MVVSFVTLFKWRLNSLLLHDGEMLLGVRHQMESLTTQLDVEVGGFTGLTGKILGRGSGSHGSWASELREVLRQAEDFVDDFLKKAYERTDGKDAEVSVAELGKELENINSRVSEILNRKKPPPPLEPPVMLEEIQRFLRSNVVYDGENETRLVSCMLSYINLPHDLKLSLLFCRAFLERFVGTIDQLAQVLVAAGLVQEKPEELMEDKAQEHIEKLISLGMIENIGVSWNHFEVAGPFFELSLPVMEAEDFDCLIANSDHMVAPTDNTTESSLHYLFFNALDGLSEASSSSSRLEGLLHNAKFLRVLDLNDTKLKSLPDEVGKLVHLRYLRVRLSNRSKLPDSISNLRNLQTLDVSWSGREFKLSNAVLNLVHLRHLTMFQPYDDGEVRVPQGISNLRNLLTLEGVYAGGGIAKELGIMTQLRSLHVRCFSDDHADELYSSVMKLSMLRKLSLSLEISGTGVRYENSIFPCLESFTPPPLLQTLELVGRLVELPVWLGSMERLTELYMYYSHLSENPTTVLQLLPNLKYLRMEHAYKGKRMGKEFFRAGGFPSLESLRICSRVLVEWTEMEEGALPCLKHLRLEDCLTLMVLPQGLQHVTTIKTLKFDAHEDLIRRLSPNGGPENYKIRNIPLVTYTGHTLPFSERIWRR